ncbi:cobyrinate a,c-diamide synthase [Streptomyces sp. M10(2022)]
MGLYDGASGQGELASTAQVSKLLRAPVALVVDASSQSRSVAALVHGFATWDPQVRIGGVILNKVASDRHEALLREALDESGLPVLGVLRRAAQVATPSRHLGLVPVAERRTEAVDAVRAMAERVRAGCDLDALLALARSAPELPDEVWEPERYPAPGERPVIAVAGGAAFTFTYAEHTELLTAAGADVVVFDPLRDEELPAGTAGLVIGGVSGDVRPELSANEPLRRAVTELALGGAPVAAECAGLLYLARELDGRPMCGCWTPRRRCRSASHSATGTRWRSVTVCWPWRGPGCAVMSSTGRCWNRAPVPPAWGMHQPERRLEGFVQQGVHASYLHTHWAGRPAWPGVSSRSAEGELTPRPRPPAR